MDITGTTAQEASETISGSVAAMKSAWENLIAGLANNNSDLDALISDVVESAETALGNIMPAAQTALEGIAELIEKLAPIIADKLPALVSDILPPLIKAASSIAQGLLEAFPDILSSVIEALPDVLAMLLEALPDVLAGLIKALPDVLTGLADVLPDLISTLILAIADAIRAIVEALAVEAFSWGRDLIDNFVEGIKERIQRVIETIREIAQSIKDLLGFSEPELGPLSNFHTFAPDMMELFAQGIRDNEHLITDQIARSFDVGPQIIDYGFGNTKTQSLEPDSETRSASPVNTSVGGTIVFNVTETIDGRVLARNMYKFNLDEASRRGPHAIS